MKKEEKTKGKPFYKKWWFWVIVAVVLVAAMGGDSESDSVKNNPTETVAEDANTMTSSEYVSEQIAVESEAPSEEKMQEEPQTEADEWPAELEIDTDFEKAVWKVVDSKEGKVTTISTTVPEGESRGSVVVGVLVKNDETVVNSLFEEIRDLVLADETVKDIIITVGDSAQGDDSELLLMALINEAGEISTSMESINYNSSYNQWVRSQFSGWDGSHKDFKNLIVKNLNDEKSFEHIETTYRAIRTDEDKDEVNAILSDSGYDNSVQIGDLFLITQFSAKNAFNATIKSTAYGIASYENNTITLIDIE